MEKLEAFKAAYQAILIAQQFMSDKQLDATYPCMNMLSAVIDTLGDVRD